MQNEPKLQNAQINTYPFIQRTYENIRPFGNPKTNPKRTQTKPISKNAKMNINSVKTKDYENKLVFRHKKNEPKTKPISIMGKNEHNLSLHKGL